MKRKNILLVDDDIVLRDLIKDALEGQCKVLTASTYAEAVNQLKNHIDLALLDYKLPDSDGLELLKTIRTERPLLPAIMMTGYSDEAVAIKAIRTGVTDYVKKPFNLRHLMKKVSEILGEGINIGYKGRERVFEAVKNRDECVMDGIAAYIEDKYTEELTLEKIAEMANMNRNKFCSAFKKRFGQTFTSYLNHMRIKRAAELLKNPDLNITEIAYFVGYGSIVHFERVFKEKYGVSPRKYRKMLNQRNR
ncbi:MAG: response regulator transcription factor [Deltaproteobacteria bacterium]|nr:response regulator transcription factor [Deltaproteobacteria bacterium]